MKKVGLVGWRGMVGSVLMQRMVEEGDFAHIDPVFFTTSAVGGKAPTLGGKEGGVLITPKNQQTAFWGENQNKEKTLLVTAPESLPQLQQTPKRK